MINHVKLKVVIFIKIDYPENEEIDTDYPFENYSNEIFMQVYDSKFQDSPRKFKFF